MPGVNRRFCPAASAALICATVSPGLAMKKELIGREVPGVLPLLQLVPCRLAWLPGTKTFQLPEESTYRYGFSEMFGVVLTVVYGGFGKLWPGTPVEPVNTMFQFEPVQEPNWSLRSMYCCWLPEFTWPVTTESPMKPPEDQPLSD